jgi:hypothetical protein
MKITPFEKSFQLILSKLNRLKRFNPLNYVFKPKETSELLTKKSVDTVVGEATEPVKITIRQRIKRNIKVAYEDYKDVAIHTLKESKTHPFKTITYLSIIGGFYAAYKTNPSYHEYRSGLIDSSNDMILLGSGTRNKKCEFYLDNINKLDNLGLLEHRDYLFFSLIKHTNFNPECDLYEKSSKHLNKPSKWNILNYPNLFLQNLSTIVDIGFFNNWIILNKRLENCDINEDEWTSFSQNSTQL